MACLLHGLLVASHLQTFVCKTQQHYSLPLLRILCLGYRTEVGVTCKQQNMHVGIIRVALSCAHKGKKYNLVRENKER